MALVNVKVIFEDSTKTFRFSVESLVSDALKEIREKLGQESALDHGLFQPEAKGKKAFWLKNNRSLRFYNITNGSELAYKKRHRILKVKLMDDSQRAVIIDSSAIIRQIIPVICSKLMIKNPDQYGLRRPTAPETEWLDVEKTLYEESVPQDETLIFAKKLFYSDFDVDKDDPVQLHLIYVQSSNDVVHGKYDPLQRSDVIDLAAVQCQVLYGNFDASKLSKTYNFNIRQFIPDMWAKDKKLERDITKEYQKLMNMSEINAKFRYLQIVRSLRTYGVSLFEVMERLRGKKKFLKCFIGIMRDRIVKLDGETREVVKEWGIEQLRRWAATTTTFTLDFGDYEDDYLVVQTEEGEQMSRIIAGYIDIILKMRNSAEQADQEDLAKEAQISNVAVNSAAALTTVTSSYSPSFAVGMSLPSPSPVSQSSVAHLSRPSNAVEFMSTVVTPESFSVASLPFPQAQQVNVTDVTTAISSLDALNSQLAAGIENFAVTSTFTSAQWREQLVTNQDQVENSVNNLLDNLMSNSDVLDDVAIDSASSALRSHVISLAVAAKNVAALDDEVPILNNVHAVSRTVAKLLSNIQQLKESPEDLQVLLSLNEGRKSVAVASSAVRHALSDQFVGEGYQKMTEGCLDSLHDLIEQSALLIESSKQYLDDPSYVEMVDDTLANNKVALSWMSHKIKPLITVSTSHNVRNEIDNYINSVKTPILQINKTLLASNSLPIEEKNKIQRLVEQITSTSRIIETAIANSKPRTFVLGAVDITEPVESIHSSVSQIQSVSLPRDMVPPTKSLAKSANQLTSIVKAIKPVSDADAHSRMVKASRSMNLLVQSLMEDVKQLNKNPRNDDVRKHLVDSSTRLESCVQDIVNEAAPQTSLLTLAYVANLSVAAMVQIVNKSSESLNSMNNPASIQEQKKQNDIASKQINTLFEATLTHSKAPEDDRAVQQLYDNARNSVSIFQDYLVQAHRYQKFIVNPNLKQDFKYQLRNTGDVIKQLDAACRIMYQHHDGQADFEDAMIDIEAAQSELDSIDFAVSQGLLQNQPGQSREHSIDLLVMSQNNLANSFAELAEAASIGKKLGQPVSNVASAITSFVDATRSVVSTFPTRNLQRKLIEASKQISLQASQFVHLARAQSVHAQDEERSSDLSTELQHINQMVGDVVTLVKGADLQEFDNMVNLLMQYSNELTTTSFTKSTYEQASQNLIACTKGLLAIASQLPAVIRSNPRGISSSIKAFISTTKNFVNASNICAASSTSPKFPNSLIVSSKAVMNSLISLAKACGSALANSNVETLDAVQSSHSTVSDVIQMFLEQFLVSSSESETAQSIGHLMRLVAKLDQPLEGNARSLSPPVLLSEFASNCQALAAASQRIITASRVSPAKAVIYVKDAADCIDRIIDNACSVACNPISTVDLGDDVLAYLTRTSKEMQSNCQLVIDSPDGMPATIAGCKSAALNATKLLALSKQVASKLVNPSQKDEQQNILRTAKNMANHTSLLAKSAPLAKKDKQAAETTLKNAIALKQSTIELENAIIRNISDQNVQSDVSETILDSSRSVALATVDLIQQACQQPVSGTSAGQPVTNLDQVVERLIMAINSLSSASSRLNPALQQVLLFEEQIQLMISELNSISLGVNTGNPPASSDLSLSYTQSKDAFISATKNVSDIVGQFARAYRPGKSLLNEGLVTQAKASLSTFFTAMVNVIANTKSNETSNELIKNTLSLLNGLYRISNEMRVVDPSDTDSMNNFKEGVDSLLLVMSQILGSMQTSVSIISDLDRIRNQIDELILKLSSPIPDNAVIDESKASNAREQAINILTKDIAQHANSLITKSSEQLGNLTLYASRLSDSLSPFVDSVITMLESSSHPNQIATEVKSSARNFLQLIQNVLLSAKSVAESPSDVDTRLALQGMAFSLFESVSNVLGAISRSAVGQVMTQKAIDNISQSLIQVASASIFAQARQLDSIRVEEPLSILQYQQRVDELFREFAPLSDQLAQATSQSPREVGLAATMVQEAFSNLTKLTTSVLKQIPDPIAQQSILSNLKMVGIRTHQFILSADELHKDQNDQTIRASFTAAQEAIRESIQQMVDKTNEISARSEADLIEQEMALDLFRSLPNINPDMVQYQGVVTAESTVADIRECLPSILEMNLAAVGNTSHSPMSSCRMAQDVILQAYVLANNSPGSSKHQIREAARGFAQSVAAFVDAKHISPLIASDPSSPIYSDLSEKARQLIQEISNLPSSADLDLSDTAQSYAQVQALNELNKCVDLLGNAPSLLVAIPDVLSRPQADISLNLDSVLSDVELTSDSARVITETVMSVTKAASALMTCAFECQNERMHNVGSPVLSSRERYHDDPTWSRGLISAAHSVVQTIKLLIESANDVLTRKSDYAVLLASARVVSSSTAQLVNATRVKANPGSSSLQNLSKEALSLNRFTSKLVHLSEEYLQPKQPLTINIQEMGLAAETKAKFDQQIKILQLEAQVEAERTRLANMNKEQYAR